jgi:hypothetical protein
MIANDSLPLLILIPLLVPDRIVAMKSAVAILVIAASEGVAMGPEVHVLDGDMDRTRRLRTWLDPQKAYLKVSIIQWCVCVSHMLRWQLHNSEMYVDG